ERFPRDADEAHDLLVRLGDLSPHEAAARGVAEGWLAALERERRAVAVRIGVPDLFLVAGSDPLESLLRRWARTHVPFVPADPAARWAVPMTSVEAALGRLAVRGDVLAGEFR